MTRSVGCRSGALRAAGVRVGAMLLASVLGAVLSATNLEAAERFALVITGASGAPEYAEKYDAWRSSIVQTLQGTMHLAEERVLVLAEEDAFSTQKATRDNVRAAVADLRRRTTKDDLLLVLLIGHGSGIGADDAKFNLVGPDLSAREWAELLAPVPAKLVFINTASGSFAFLEAVSGRGRVVVTANDSAQQQFETIFPEFLIAAFKDRGADLDKNGKVSVFEAFTFASAGVKTWYEQRGQLATERALLDDNGDGVGRLSEEQGPDGILAMTSYIQAEEPIVDTGDPERTALLRRKAEINQRLEELRARKPTVAPEEYDAVLERLLLELARIDRSLRSKS